MGAKRRQALSDRCLSAESVPRRLFSDRTDEFITLLAMFWSRNFYVETGLNGHGQNSCWRGTALGRVADRKESLEQSVEIIGKKRGEKKKVVGNKKGSNRNE